MFLLLSPLLFIGTFPRELLPFFSFLLITLLTNLAQFPYPMKGPVEIIFCRNVMIYFDTNLRSKIISEFHRILAPGGHLFIGHSENLLGIKHNFKRVGASWFQKS